MTPINEITRVNVLVGYILCILLQKRKARSNFDALVRTVRVRWRAQRNLNMRVHA